MGRRQVGRHQGTDGRGMATWAQAEKVTGGDAGEANAETSCSGDQGQIRNLMSVLFNHSIRWDLA